MSSSQRDASGSPVQLARELATTAAAVSVRAERERRLPAELVDALADAGLFRLCVPRALGGLEADVGTLVSAIEQLATGDGAAAWCVAVGATSGMLGAYLSEPAAREIYGDPATVTGGVFAPKGRAVPQADGYRVSGRWAFASGVGHCAWLMGGCLVQDPGGPRRLPGGAPDVRLMLFPAEQVRIIDTWSVSGLRATGSHDMEVADVDVLLERSVSLLADRPRHSGPLYAFPVFGLLALSIAAVALGIARAAIDDLLELAGAKTPAGSRRPLAERPSVQAQMARAEAELGAARAFLHEAVGQAWLDAETGDEVTPTRRTRLRLAATHATSAAARVVDAAYDAGGGSSIYDSSPLQRRFRDVHVATQHMMVGPGTWELAGRMLLGLPTDTAQL